MLVEFDDEAVKNRVMLRLLGNAEAMLPEANRNNRGQALIEQFLTLFPLDAIRTFRVGNDVVVKRPTKEELTLDLLGLPQIHLLSISVTDPVVTLPVTLEDPIVRALSDVNIPKEYHEKILPADEVVVSIGLMFKEYGLKDSDFLVIDLPEARIQSGNREINRSRTVLVAVAGQAYKKLASDFLKKMALLDVGTQMYAEYDHSMNGFFLPNDAEKAYKMSFEKNYPEGAHRWEKPKAVLEKILDDAAFSKKDDNLLIDARSIASKSNPEFALMLHHVISASPTSNRSR